MANSSYTALATNIFTAPREAFVALKEQPRVLLPVLVLLVGYSIVSFYFLSHVDMGFFLDNQIRSGNANVTDAQREQAVAAAAKIPPLVYGALGAVASNVAVFSIILLVAAYFTVVSFMTNDGVKLKQWFALLCWCTLPQVLGIIAQLVNMTVNDPRFMLQDQIDPLALGNLLSIDRTGAPMVQRILLGINVTALWSLVLQVLGYQSFTKKPYATSAAIVLGPLALIVAIGTLVALLRQ
jgi:Yip1-like protein